MTSPAPWTHGTERCPCCGRYDIKDGKNNIICSVEDIADAALMVEAPTLRERIDAAIDGLESVLPLAKKWAEYCRAEYGDHSLDDRLSIASAALQKARGE